MTEAVHVGEPSHRLGARGPARWSAAHMLPPLTLNAWLSHDYIVAEVCRLPAGAAVLEVGAWQGAMGTRLAQRLN